MITSTSNQQVKNLIQLQKKAKARREQQLYVVEGIRMFREAPARQIAQIYVSESFYRDSEHKALLEEKQREIRIGGENVSSDGRGIRMEVLSDHVFAHVSDTQTPQGVLCLMKMPGYGLEQLLQEHRGGLWLVLENVQDPGNLGTMFRTGEGAGIAGVIMDASTVDIFNPKTIRSTMGAIYRVPFVISRDLQEAVRTLQHHEVKVYAAHLEGSVCYDIPDYCAGSAFLIGNEGNGLTAELTACADTYIRIPMGGRLESLNAAMAAGILMYEANRQRRTMHR